MLSDDIDRAFAYIFLPRPCGGVGFFPLLSTRFGVVATMRIRRSALTKEDPVACALWRRCKYKLAYRHAGLNVPMVHSVRARCFTHKVVVSWVVGCSEFFNMLYYHYSS